MNTAGRGHPSRAYVQVAGGSGWHCPAGSGRAEATSNDGQMIKGLVSIFRDRALYLRFVSGRRDSNPRPLVTNRSRPMLVIGCQKWALTCQDGLDQ
jgi:hypothetical protein